jgi:hypothetical protein
MYFPALIAVPLVADMLGPPGFKLPVVNVAATPAALKDNKLSGSVVPLKGDGTVQ